MFKSKILAFLATIYLVFLLMRIHRRPAPTVGRFRCPDCPRKFVNKSGLTQHENSAHRELTPPDEDERSEDHSFRYTRHPVLTGRPCNRHGEEIPPFTPPEPRHGVAEAGSWSPFEDRVQFDFVYTLYSDAKTSERITNNLLNIWAAGIRQQNLDAEMRWKDTESLLLTIDEIQHGSCPWKTYEVRYDGPMPPNPPKWMTETYEVCCRDSRLLLQEQLQTSDFKDKIHYTTYRQFNSVGKRIWSNLMSSDWAWKQADKIAAEYPELADGAMFVPIVAGSDKTTVSVGTGHQMYHPVYMSLGNITNIARRAHGNGMLPVGFLPIPKVSKNEQKSPEFAKFSRQLYHACLARIFKPLKPGMTSPELVQCPDQHYRWAFYGLGPYIADYPEQVFLSGIVQNWCPKCDAIPDALDAPGALPRTQDKTDFLKLMYDSDVLWKDYGIRCDYKPFTYEFPRADIHELMAPDLLHQVIKGTFKDHIVTWVYEYLVAEHGKAEANRIQEDIDRRMAATPIYPGLRRFPEGRNFEQWTGNDSKALMKVYLACIVGYVPTRMVQCLAAFLDFCYIARKNSLSSVDLNDLDAAIQRFHLHRQVFVDAGVRDDISLPRQHSLVHYARSIRLFGSPNGLCSSITESKHIVAVKKPWRASSRYHALSQMLRRISREEKLEAARREFTRQGMMEGSTLSYTEMILEGGGPVPHAEDGDDGGEEDEDGEDLGPVEGPKVLSSIKLARTSERQYPRRLQELAEYINQPAFPTALRRFLWSELNPNSERPIHLIPLNECPAFSGRIRVYHSAVAHFFAPSDVCGAGGMHHERIRSTPCWRNEYERRDTVLVETDSELPGMRGMVVGRVYLFFSFHFDGRDYSCAFLHWFDHTAEEPDEETGLWVVKPEYIGNRRSMAVVHLDAIARGIHLLPIFNHTPLSATFHFSDSLDAFSAFFVNRYIDHHSYEFI